MQYIELDTAQNVRIRFHLATAADRVAATLLDLLVIIGYLLLLFLINKSLASIGVMLFGSSAVVVLLIVPVFVYDLLWESFLGGRTPGKMLMRTQVIRMDGAQPTLLNYTLRWLLRPVEIMICNGAIAMLVFLINGKGQRLGDLAAGTTVVKLSPTVSPDALAAVKIAPRYNPRYPMALQLRDSDINIINDVLNLRLADITKEKKEEALAKTADAVAKKIGAVVAGTPAEFLTQVVNDYTRLAEERDRRRR